MVSQLTALPVLGVSPRRFRELVLEHRIRHARLGKLVLVAVDDWLAAMGKLSTAPEPTPAPEYSNDAPTVDDFLRRMGRVRT
jgi:hypothetical protein